MAWGGAEAPPAPPVGTPLPWVDNLIITTYHTNRFYGGIYFMLRFLNEGKGIDDVGDVVLSTNEDNSKRIKASEFD